MQLHPCWCCFHLRLMLCTDTVQLTCQWKYATVLVPAVEMHAPVSAKLTSLLLQHDLKDTKNPIWKDSLSSTGQSKPISVIPLRTWPSSSQAACFEQVWWETVRAVLRVETMLSDAGDAGHLPTAGHRHQEVLYPYHLMDRWFDQSRGVWSDARFRPHNWMTNH